MSKKSFKNEPALQFMSSAAEVAEKNGRGKGKSALAEDVRVDGYTISPMYLETKSKRFNMLMRPTLFEYLQRRAKERNISVNEFIHSILEVYIEAEKQKME